MNAATGPLSDAELDELEAYLASAALPEDTMDLAMLDGFLTALAVGPQLIGPEHWLPLVWSDRVASEEVARQSPEQVARVEGLILRHWNFLRAQLQAEPEAYVPILFTFEDEGQEGREVVSVDEWCIGFVRGINVDGDAWQASMDDAGIEEYLWPILLHGTEAGAQELDDNPELAAEFDDLAEALPDCVLAIYDFWRPERAARTTVRAEKTGRNAPCPCGSGKKFKHCHGRTM